MPPLKYRVECRDNFTERGAQRMSDLWNYTTVKRILRNRVYLGHTLLGKSRKVSVKSKKKVKVPEEEWVFTKNTHEALVSQEKFDLAAHFMGENTKANGANPAFRHSIFGGIAYCACCGNVFRRLRLQRRTGEILVSGMQQPEFQSADPLPAWGAYPLR